MLQTLVPEGLPVTKRWLTKQSSESDRHALDNLLKSKQLKALAPGVYVRPGTHVTWQGVVAALQAIFGRDLSVGGLTALELQGFCPLPAAVAPTIGASLRQGCFAGLAEPCLTARAGLPGGADGCSGGNLFRACQSTASGHDNAVAARMEQLLRKCTNVKIRRLFYWMAERNAYAWVKKLPAPDALARSALAAVTGFWPRAADSIQNIA